MSATTRTERLPPPPRPSDPDPYADYVALVSPFNGETCRYPPIVAEELMKRGFTRSAAARSH